MVTRQFIAKLLIKGFFNLVNKRVCGFCDCHMSMVVRTRGVMQLFLDMELFIALRIYYYYYYLNVLGAFYNVLMLVQQDKNN